MAETKMRAVMTNETRRIVNASRNPSISSGNTFIINRKEYKFQEAQQFSDEELANAIVVNAYGYYLRRGLQDVSSDKEFRHSPTQDWVKEEYKATIDYEEVDADEPDPKVKKNFMEWLRECHKMKEIKKSQANARKMIADARDPKISSAYEFIIDGISYSFKSAQMFSDEALANAIVIDGNGYYVRRALEDMSKKYQRKTSSLNVIKEEYKYRESK